MINKFKSHYKNFTLCKIVRNKKASLSILVLIHIILLTSITYDGFDGNIKFSILLITFTIPIIILVLLIFDTNIYRCIIKYKWINIIMFLVTSIYIIFSNVYASNILNETFKVDSSFFPITKIFLTYIYSINILKYFTFFTYIYSSIFGGFVIFLLIISNKAKYIFPFIGITLYITIVNATYFRFISDIIPITKKLAISMDFNSYYECKYINSAKAVVFINDNNVVSLYENNMTKQLSFRIEKCN